MRKIVLFGSLLAFFEISLINTKIDGDSESNQYVQPDGSIFIPEGETPTIVDHSDNTYTLNRSVYPVKLIKSMRASKRKNYLKEKVYQELTVVNMMGIQFRYAGYIPKKRSIKYGATYLAYYEGEIVGSYIK